MNSPASTKYGRLTRFLCLLLALHFFNLSIDPPDPQPDNVPEDLSINEVESILELIVETWFGWEDAFEEHDDNDSKRCILDFSGVYFTRHDHMLADDVLHATAIDEFTISDDRKVCSMSREINSPPPEA